MPTDQQQLQATLADLHRQLSDTRNLDTEVRQQLSTVLRDIQAILEQSDDAKPAVSTEANASLTGRLGDAAAHFEETHPTLAGTINSIVDTLARMGI